MTTATLPDALRDALAAFVSQSGDPFAALNAVQEHLLAVSPNQDPIGAVRWVPHELVEPNDYNPNSVAKVEMGLLLTSIMADGYTQPIVTIWDEDKGKYVIVDGFHRYFTMKSSKDLQERVNGHLPVVVIDAPPEHRMASTVRHNRARGKHSVQGMSSLVFQMLERGMTDAEVCNELGMEPDEILRLKHITGFSKLFEDAEYKKAWVTRSQLDRRRQYVEAGGERAPVP